MNLKLIRTNLLLLGLLTFTSCTSLTTNGLVNEGFETVSDGKNPVGWVANNLNLSKKHAELSVDNSISHSGDRSIFISISDHHPPNMIIYNWFKRVDGLQPGWIYELDAWIKTEKIKYSPFIEIQFWNKLKMVGVTSTLQDNFIKGTRNWVPVKKTISIPKGTTKILLKAALQSLGNNGGRVWFDDIRIKKVE